MHARTRVPPVAQLMRAARNLKFRTILDYGGPDARSAHLHTRTHKGCAGVRERQLHHHHQQQKRSVPTAAIPQCGMCTRTAAVHTHKSSLDLEPAAGRTPRGDARPCCECPRASRATCARTHVRGTIVMLVVRCGNVAVRDRGCSSVHLHSVSIYVVFVCGVWCAITKYTTQRSALTHAPHNCPHGLTYTRRTGPRERVCDARAHCQYSNINHSSQPY